MGRSPPKSRVNPPPPGDFPPLWHFSTLCPFNPFPSFSFPFLSLHFPYLPSSWLVLAPLGSIFLRNLGPSWAPKPIQIEKKWGLDGVPIWTSFLHRFLLVFCSDFGPPETLKFIKIHLFYNSFLFFTQSKIRSIFNSILVVIWLHFRCKNR